MFRVSAASWKAVVAGVVLSIALGLALSAGADDAGSAGWMQADASTDGNSADAPPPEPKCGNFVPSPPPNSTWMFIYLGGHYLQPSYDLRKFPLWKVAYKAAPYNATAGMPITGPAFDAAAVHATRGALWCAAVALPSSLGNNVLLQGTGRFLTTEWTTIKDWRSCTTTDPCRVRANVDPGYMAAMDLIWDRAREYSQLPPEVRLGLENALVAAFLGEAGNPMLAAKSLREIADLGGVREGYLAWLVAKADATSTCSAGKFCEAGFSPKTWAAKDKSEAIALEEKRQKVAGDLPKDQVAAKKILTDASPQASLPAGSPDPEKWTGVAKKLENEPGYKGLDVGKGVLTIKKSGL